MTRIARPAVSMLILGAAMLAGCGSSGPPPVTYVLGSPAQAGDRVQPLAGRPSIEVRPAQIPDFLDTSDIQLRQAGNVVVPSPTGRWAERLSAGITRAVAAGLAQRLPGIVIVTTTSVERPAQQVLLELQAFEPRADRTVALIGRWRVVDGAARDTLAGESVSLSVPLAGQGDAEVVAAMSRAIDDMAERIAGGIRRSMPRAAATPPGATRSPR